MRQELRVELQALGLRLFDDPVQGFVRESVGRVAAADIGVDAGEPGLFEMAGPSGRAPPDVRGESFSLLVDSEGVIGVLNVRAETDVVIFILVAVEERWPVRKVRGSRQSTPSAHDS